MLFEIAEIVSLTGVIPFSPKLNNLCYFAKISYQNLKAPKFKIMSVRDKGFNRTKMTYNRLKNGFTWPKYFDCQIDQIDQILFLSKKV
jgi:hypothetical protein